jgi:hypothetical protein
VECLLVRSLFRGRGESVLLPLVVWFLVRFPLKKTRLLLVFIFLLLIKLAAKRFLLSFWKKGQLRK